MAKGYRVIIGQCLPTIQNHIETSDELVAMNNALDALQLLQIIHQTLYNCTMRVKRHSHAHQH